MAMRMCGGSVPGPKSSMPQSCQLFRAEEPLRLDHRIVDAVGFKFSWIHTRMRSRQPAPPSEAYSIAPQRKANMVFGAAYSHRMGHEMQRLFENRV